MKPDSMNNLSKGRSSRDSSTENNSSSDSDMEFVGTSAQGLRKTKENHERKICELERKLAEAEIHAKAQKEKVNLLESCIKDKDNVIRTLQMSIGLVNQTKDLSLQSMQSQIVELQNALDLSKSSTSTSGSADSNYQHGKKNNALNSEIEKLKKKSDELVEFNDETQNYEKNLREKEEQIARLEFKVDESKLKIMKLEGVVQDKEHQLVEMAQKLSAYTLGTEDTSDSHVFLNSSKVPSMKLVTLPDFAPFAAVFEDIPSAGAGWMVIQRRIDGSFDKVIVPELVNGCGELDGEFWIGLEKLHRITTSRRLELYIHLVDFDNVTAFARYDNFVVGGKNDKYKLVSLGKYSGNAGDALRSHINHTSIEDSSYFAPSSKWWGRNDCNLNGTYCRSKVQLNTCDGIWWGRWNMGKRYSLKSCKMLIRPKP
ncbi:fibrinogen-like protein 1 isoform X2 [Drosophila biarmipes]|uniref:fibrinogen-like protein 1 isoform X2 n=1 Tax=Drosophila biarmipes TaxID=125945 RepID=UPI0007E7B0BB|nr:fibrinogen-like protein 1 isoform X2 [Drosophila biarmipes]XP_050741762.1 fibrinogen-like protein 1 isoform X2 [Drosophila biarmipes]